MGRFIGAERSRSRDPGGAPCNGNSEVVCLPERDGEFPPVFCARPEPLRFMYWKSPRDAPRAFFVPLRIAPGGPPHALDYSEYLSITIFRPLMDAPPLGRKRSEMLRTESPDGLDPLLEIVARDERVPLDLRPVVVGNRRRKPRPQTQDAAPEQAKPAAQDAAARCV